MNIFEQAVRQQIRLEVNGSISIEQLYSAKPNVSFINALENYEESLENELSKLEKPSRRKNVEKSELRKQLELKLAIVTGYLDEQENLRKRREEQASLKAEEQRLLELISRKKEELDGSKTIEELEESLAKLRNK